MPHWPQVGKRNAMAWRDHLPVHPAAEMFPPPDELRARKKPTKKKRWTEDTGMAGVNTAVATAMPVATVVTTANRDGSGDEQADPFGLPGFLDRRAAP
jgi:hypothetical protein